MCRILRAIAYIIYAICQHELILTVCEDIADNYTAPPDWVEEAGLNEEGEDDHREKWEYFAESAGRFESCFYRRRDIYYNQAQEGRMHLYLHLRHYERRNFTTTDEYVGKPNRMIVLLCSYSLWNKKRKVLRLT